MKFAGKRENWVEMEALNDPVAATRGVLELNSNPGTRGIVKTRMIPTLIG